MLGSYRYPGYSESTDDPERPPRWQGRREMVAWFISPFLVSFAVWFWRKLQSSCLVVHRVPPCPDSRIGMKGRGWWQTPKGAKLQVYIISYIYTYIYIHDAWLPSIVAPWPLQPREMRPRWISRVFKLDPWPSGWVHGLMCPYTR